MNAMPLIQLIEVNAKNVHSNLALRYFRELLSKEGYSSDLCTMTINMEKSLQLMRILNTPAPLGRVVLFSVYIWNLDQMLWLAEAVKAIEPSAIIVFGGPEVSFHSSDWLRLNPQVDIISANEGEGFIDFLVNLLNKGDALQDLNAYKGHILSFESCNIDSLPLGYTEDELKAFHILYYEASRGCPYRCSFCMSAEGVTLRYKNLEQVEKDLIRLTTYPNKIVKLIDRTFNVPEKRAKALIELFTKYDNGTVTFHLEVSPTGLNDDFIQLISSLRPGLVQFEVGIQSTNPETLQAIQRVMPDDVLSSVEKLCRLSNCHTHVDLIAGLPEDTYETFVIAVDSVLGICPDHLQLGMLKLLHGAPLTRAASKYGYKYDNKPPYGFHYHDKLSFGDKLRLECIEEGLERLYNVEKWPESLTSLNRCLPAPHQFYERVGGKIKEQALLGIKLSLEQVLHLSLEVLDFVDASLRPVFTTSVAIESFMRDYSQLNLLKNYAYENVALSHQIVRQMQELNVPGFTSGAIKYLVKAYRAMAIDREAYDRAVAAGFLSRLPVQIAFDAPEIKDNQVLLFKLKENQNYYAAYNVKE